MPAKALEFGQIGGDRGFVGSGTADTQTKNGYCGGGGYPPMNCDQRFSNIETRLDRVEYRLDRVEQRLDKVETSLDNLRMEVKGNFKWLVGLFITAIVAIIGTLVVIDQRQESWIQHGIGQIQATSQALIESNNAANRALLEQIDRRHSENLGALRREIDNIQ